MFKHRFLSSAAILAVIGSGFTTTPAGAAGNGTRAIAAAGVTIFRSTASGSTELAPREIRAGSSDAGGGTGAGAPVVGAPDRSRSQDKGANGGDGGGNGDNQGSKAGALQVLASVNGLRHRDQRLANDGNQFSVEPPDQGLCAGNGFVVEPVNTVLRIYNESGTALTGVEDLNTFFGYAAQFDRTNGLVGPFVTDPSCYFDKDTQRWFLDVLTLEVFPDTGNFRGPNHLDLAVSRTADPRGAWMIYSLPVQDDGSQGTPDHGCATGPAPQAPDNPNACIGDYPHIGADANGFYITTNEYDLFGPNFQGAQIYAFSKRALAANATPVGVTQFDTRDTKAAGRPGFTVWPATSPAGIYARGNGGTEYFMSSDAADEVNPSRPASAQKVSNRLIVWSLTNTNSLGSTNPDLRLQNTVLRVGRYVVPAPSEQKAGNFPLGQCVNDTTLAIPADFLPPSGATGCWQLLLFNEPPHDMKVSKIDSNDSRMQQVVFADGKLWGALDTGVRIKGHDQAGIEWFVVKPQSSDEGLDAELANQGYLAMARNNLNYPAIAVTPSGQGAIAFTLVGKDHYPSAAFAAINSQGTGEVQIAAEGLGPSDSFTDYHPFTDPFPFRPRWGDYGGAVVDGNNIWLASEYIGQTCTLAQYTDFAAARSGASPLLSCGRTRTGLGNWFTRITKVRPTGGNR